MTSQNKITTDIFSDFIKKAEMEEFKDMILVYPGSITSQVKSNIEELENIITIQLFELSDVIVNITEHEMVPKHTLLNKE